MAYTKTTWITGSTPLSANNMNHIEQGIKDAHDMIAAITETIFPVGSYYETSNAGFNPNGVFSGAWILEKEGQVHVSAGSGYPVAGAISNTSDGGTKDGVIPYHNHSIPALSGSAASTGAHTHSISASVVANGSHSHTTYSAGAHTHGTGDGTLTSFNIQNTTKMSRRVLGGSGDGYQWTTDSTGSYSALGYTTSTSSAGSHSHSTDSQGSHSHSINASSASAGSHTHTVTTTASSTGTVGTSGNLSGANMMPYINVYRWHRTA